MDIRSMGEANVRKFYEMELLQSIPDIYTMDIDRLKGTDGFGEKSLTNLKNAIEQSKQQPLHRLIYALGIRYVGETTAKTLAQKVNDVFSFQNMSIAALQELDDVGVKVAASIHDFFQNDDNKKMLEALKQAGLQTESKAVEMKDGKLQQQTFLFTGTLTGMKRSDAEAMVEERGGKILGGVSSKLNYLVAGEEAGSKLEKARKIPSIKILSEQEFLTLLNA